MITGILTWLCVFLGEIVVLFVCYRCIYQKKNVESQSLSRFCKLLWEYFYFMRKYRKHSSLQDYEMNAFLEENESIRGAFSRFLLVGSVALFGMPTIAVFFVSVMHSALLWILFPLAEVSVFWDMIKKNRIALTKFLYEGRKFLYLFDRKKRKISKTEINKNIDKKDENSSKKGQLKGDDILENINMILIILCSDFILILVVRDFLIRGLKGIFSLKDSVYGTLIYWTAVAVWLILVFVWYWLQNGKKSKGNKSCRKKRGEADGLEEYDREGVSWEEKMHGFSRSYHVKVEIRPEDRGLLGKWEKETARICEQLKINAVRIEIGEGGMDTIYSYVSWGEVPKIVIGYGVFVKAQRYTGQEYFEVIRLLMAHELVHIHYKDTFFLKKVGMVLLAYVGSALALLFLIAKSSVAGMLLPFVVLVAMVSFMGLAVLGEKRYWLQVMEFRADRVGMALSGTGPEILEKALKCAMEDKEEESAGKAGIGLIYRLYQKRVEEQVHPSVRRRVSEAERGHPWGLGEYFRYYKLIGLSVITGKGWRI